MERRKQKTRPGRVSETGTVAAEQIWLERIAAARTVASSKISDRASGVSRSHAQCTIANAISANPANGAGRIEPSYAVR
jgi:hypothetical protein